MTAEEIRKVRPTSTDTADIGMLCGAMLQEIAAQLAELNAKKAVTETTSETLFEAMTDAAFLEGYLRNEKPDIHDKADRVANVLQKLCLEARNAEREDQV